MLCHPNRLPLLLASNRNNLRIIILVMCVFEGAGINARLLDSYNCDFQVVENCMTSGLFQANCSVFTLRYLAMEISDKNNSMLCMSCPCCKSSISSSFADRNID